MRLGSIFQYVGQLTAIVFSKPKRSFLADHAYRKKHLVESTTMKLSAKERKARNEQALKKAIGWLMYAQDATEDGGFASYHLTNGWGATYPETTGYILPTLIEFSRNNKVKALQERVDKAAGLLLRIQLPTGGWEGGRVGEGNPETVFNTAQIIRGLIRLYQLNKQQQHLDAATIAAKRLCELQDEDGAWRKGAFMGKARVYDSYVDDVLLALYRITGDDRFKQAAVKNLEWVLTQQEANGWFTNCDNTSHKNDRPITHTIAYTIDGLLESGRILKDQRFVEAGRKAADALLGRFEEYGFLFGRYDKDWYGSEDTVTTGNAQLAICWFCLYEKTKEEKYRASAQKMVDQLVFLQERSFQEAWDTTGALSGSFPIWGRYEKFAFPNWATKYLADALLLDVRFSKA